MPFQMRLFGRSDLETWRRIGGLDRSGHDHARGRRRQLSDRCKTRSRYADRVRRETYEAADRIASGCHPERQRRRLMISPRGGLVMCVRLFIADYVVLDRRSSGVHERHQWSMTKAHETEHDRKNDAAQCGSGSVRAWKLCSHGPVGYQSRYRARHHMADCSGGSFVFQPSIVDELAVHESILRILRECTEIDSFSRYCLAI